MLEIAFACFISYLVGSIPTAYVVGKLLKGIDIREHGSGNAGATNVFRVVGKGWGVGVLLFDALKGAFAVRVVSSFFSTSVLSLPTLQLVSGIAAIMGHTWTVWLKFKGGKGVATSAGVFIALVPKAALCSLAIFLGLFIWRRYVSLGSLGAAVTFPFWVILFYRTSEVFPLLLPISFFLVGFIFYTHRENIERLRAGTEKKLG